MTSEIRTNSFKSRAGLSTVTMTDSGPMFSGITTFVDNSGFTFGVGGGTSIFTPATNVLTFGTNNTEKVRIDGDGNANITGVTTAANFKTGVSNLHDVGLTLSGGQIDVGSNIKIGTAGVVTATSFVGDGSNLTGIDVGISTEALTTAGGTVTLDLTKDDHKITKSGTYTVTCTGGSEGSSHSLRIENSGTSSVSFSSYFKFPSGGTPSLPTTNGAISLISFTVHKAGSVGVNTVLLAGASVNYS